jgi:hypothetical protein
VASPLNVCHNVWEREDSPKFSWLFKGVRRGFNSNSREDLDRNHKDISSEKVEDHVGSKSTRHRKKSKHLASRGYPSWRLLPDDDGCLIPLFLTKVSSAVTPCCSKSRLRTIVEVTQHPIPLPLSLDASSWLMDVLMIASEKDWASPTEESTKLYKVEQLL